MVKEVLTGKCPVVLAAVVITALFATGICLAADDADADTSKDSSIEIPKRVQEAIAGVKELSKEEKEKLEAVKRQQYLDDYHDEPAGSLLSKEDIDKIEQETKEKEKAILARAKLKIEAQEEQAANIESIPSQEFRPSLPLVSHAEGTVTGIVLYMGKGAALVLGDVIREGDMIRGITVVSITPDYVEFEKQGKKWKQVVGQPPPAGVWEKPKTQQKVNAEKTGRRP
jgi:hypothetical protein